jgi:hypothetical protein
MSYLVSRINEMQDFCLNYNNIEKLSKNIMIKSIESKNNKNNKILENNKIKDSEISLFKTKYNDKLFWIFYILKYGIEDYNFIGKNHFFIEQEEKISQIKLIRENKELLKKNKWKKSKLEPNLIGDKNIDLSTFFCICFLNNIDLCIINNKCLYDCVNESYDTKINIIHKKNNEYSLDLIKINLENYKKMKEKYWIIDNLSKPLKGVSSYKVSELITICKKIGITIYKKINNKEKVLTKKELYLSLSEYI